MQKAFKITDQNADLYRKYVTQKRAINDYRELTRKFLKKHGIDTDEHKSDFCYTERLTVDLNHEQEEKFKSQIMKDPGPYGMCRFKKNSKTQKAFDEEVTNHASIHDINCLRSWPFEYGLYGHVRYNLWMYKDDLYGMFESDRDISFAEFMEEIPMSEYYHTIETLEAEQKNN